MTSSFCLDFGNTRQKLAVFNDGRLAQVIVLNQPHADEIEVLIHKYKPTTSILSSVIDHKAEVESVLKQHTAFHKLTNTSKLPFTIPVGKPETVGADRLAIAAAAVHYFPHQNNLAIALGSCITYNFINKFHELVGGSISPGMEMRFSAMHQFTAKLPLVKGDWNVPLIGYDTKSNLQCGVVLGMAKEIDGIIDEYKKRFGNFNVLLTGGDTAIFDPHIKNKIFADPELIFKGLYVISTVNHS